MLVGSVDFMDVQFAKILDDQLAKFRTQIGDWKVVWGPALFQSNPAPNVGNAMFVAQSLDEPSRLVVSIAGTNPFSAFDWLTEDFFVGDLIPWPHAAPSDGLEPKIANGTHQGLTIIQQLSPVAHLPGAGNGGFSLLPWGV